MEYFIVEGLIKDDGLLVYIKKESGIRN